MLRAEMRRAFAVDGRLARHRHGADTVLVVQSQDRHSHRDRHQTFDRHAGMSMRLMIKFIRHMRQKCKNMQYRVYNT